MRFSMEYTAAIVVDYQEKLVPVMEGKEELIAASKVYLAGLKELGIPMIVTQQYTKGIGNTIPEIAECLGDFTAYDKNTFSICKNEEIYAAVKALGKKNILISGVEAHICVLQTAIDLKADGYNVFLVEDCIASRKKSNKENAVKRAMGEGIFITCGESVLYELLVNSANPHFKAVSKIVK